VTRAEIEHVRGVDVGAVLRSLLERRLLRIAGHREVAGRPMLYATTRRFLEVFGLPRIEDLPTLRDLQELAPPEAATAAAPEAEAAAEDPPEGDAPDPLEDAGDERDETEDAEVDLVDERE
jgi:segregation and condensation protein B